MNRQTLWNRDFLTICISSFFLFMTFYMHAVTLPSFVLDQLHGSQGEIGLVMTVYVIAGVILRPLTGKWFDEWNRKRMIVFSLLLFTACSLLYSFVQSYDLLLLLRIVHGMAFGISATATAAAAAEIIPDHRKGEGIGYFSLFMSLAMVIGPFLGLTLQTHVSYSTLFLTCAAFSFLSLLTGSATALPKAVPRADTAKGWSWTQLIEPKAIPISLAGCVLAFSYGAIATFISVYAKSLGLESSAGFFFMVFAAAIVVSRPFTGPLFDRIGPNVLVYPGIVLFVLGMVGLSQVHTTIAFFVSAGVIGLGFGALIPAFQTIAVQSAPGHRRGLATGTYFVLFDSGYGLGAFLLGLIAAATSYHTMYLIAGLTVALTGMIYYALIHRKANKPALAAQTTISS